MCVQYENKHFKINTQIDHLYDGWTILKSIEGNTNQITETVDETGNGNKYVTVKIMFRENKD